MITVLLILAIAIAAFFYLMTNYAICPRCDQITPKCKMHYVADLDDIELYCHECGYSFCLTDKQLSVDGIPSADIDPAVWNRDYEHYKNEELKK